MVEPSSPRILVTRFDSRGLCVLTLPLLNALRAHYPNAFIAWLTDVRFRRMAKLHTAVDQPIALPVGDWQAPVKLLAMAMRIRRLRFDLVLDPQSDSASALVARLSGARKRIGAGRSTARGLGKLLNSRPNDSGASDEIDRMLDLLIPLGVRAPHIQFAVPECPIAKDEIDQFISATHLGCGFAVIGPGFDGPTGSWPLSSYARVAKHLGRKRSIPSVIIGAGKVDRSDIGWIVRKSGGHAFDAPSSHLMQAAALLRASLFFVGANSELLHLASAVGTRCIAIGPRPEFKISSKPGRNRFFVHANESTQSNVAGRSPDNIVASIDIQSVCDLCDEVIENGEIPLGHVA